MAPLPTELRSLLEKAVLAARDAAEGAAGAAIRSLAVDLGEPFQSLDQDQRQLRRQLRERARQLGDGSQTKGFDPLVEEVAYVQWHRMLFARFLAENGLLMHPSGVAVTLEECAELAPEEGEPDGWMVAARYAAAMLPGIFGETGPASLVRFAPEGRQRLEQIIAGLPPPIFLADDSLGWVYQFWQSRRKKEVNASGRKIGGADLAPVTQLFTEDYMVRFLLENSLGAWWAARHPDSPLLEGWEYLRFKEDGSPAAGSLPGWPERAAEVTVMDPCCGSGHFLVAAFEMLRAMRMEEEGLSEVEAGDAVLRDNLFGLELDERCVQIAAFSVAFAAWKAGGYRPLPPLNLACSGTPVTGQLEEWKKLANGDGELAFALERLYNLFRNAPELGSLIDPTNAPVRDGMFAVDYSRVEPLLAKALAKERVRSDPVADLFGHAVEGVARATKLLARSYVLVATNVPYLLRRKQSELLQSFCDSRYTLGRGNLATAFLERCRSLANEGGAYALVTPQNWLTLGTYEALRRSLLEEQIWRCLALLGVGAFETISGEVVDVVLLINENSWPQEDILAGINVKAATQARDKITALQLAPLVYVSQHAQLEHPDHRVVLDQLGSAQLLETIAHSFKGCGTGDDPHFRRFFWESPCIPSGWRGFQSSVRTTQAYGGCESVLDIAQITAPGIAEVYIRGESTWGKRGVAVTQTGSLASSLSVGEPFDQNVAIILPKNSSHLPAIWAFCQSKDFRIAVRRIDKTLKVTNATLVKVPFDLAYWQKVADEAGPLPEPHSDDPTQWLFKGHPAGSTEPLQVAVARLLGYRWPQQEAGALDGIADEDGIVCLPAVAGDLPAAERLRALLAAAYGVEWSPALQERLLASVGFVGKGLDEWLRDGFFAQHCRLFHNRPFIWHVWDGRKDGFSALVNYHRLDGQNLNRLIYRYLGNWISARREDRDAGVPAAEARLVAALDLQKKLELIRDGEASPDGKSSYDVYVRWKPRDKQPIGWEPDLNDGVRLNIRPFVTTGVLRSRFTIHWNKDRGANPDGSERLNDKHLTLAVKREARAK